MGDDAAQGDARPAVVGALASQERNRSISSC